MALIGISYTPSGGSPIYNIVLDNFGSEELPRTYMEAAGFSQSANGASILSGSAFRQKFQWVISSLMPKDEALQLKKMFEDWDLDRASGLPVACGIIDETFGDQVSSNVVFATSPSFVYKGPKFYLVSFGLMEV